MPRPHTAGRNAVEHLERSGELCGWAVVENGAQRGKERNESLGWSETEGVASAKYVSRECMICLNACAGSPAAHDRARNVVGSWLNDCGSREQERTVNDKDDLL